MAGPELLTPTAELRARRRELRQKVLALRVHGARRRHLLAEVAALTRQLLELEAEAGRAAARSIRSADEKWFQR